jgi:hypothetical protein
LRNRNAAADNLTHQIMKLPKQRFLDKPLTLLMCGILSLLCSCASTSLKQTWKTPGYEGGPVGPIAVLAVVDRGRVRQGVENRFVNQFRKAEQPALTTFNLLTLSAAKEDKQAAAAKLQHAGASAVMLVSLVDVSSAHREMRAGPERYAGVTTGFDTLGWYDYYSLALVDMSTTYGSTKKRVVLDISLFDLKTGQHLWSAMTESALSETTDGVVELDTVVAKVVERLRADGMVR